MKNMTERGHEFNPAGRAGKTARVNKAGRAALLTGASALVIGAFAPAALAQDTTEDEIIVTGVRGSLMRAADIKRNSDGVVDAISAEDIGKFPDTNLAESLQRITGVSIDRINGEGSQVTVRGFGSEFNLITLNGRQMPTANIPTIGVANDLEFNAGNTRTFDFSTIASEGVTGLQVYKSGRADAPTGGIGATVNVSTLRPLDRPGFNFTVGAKALHDTTVIRGDEITPEMSGLASWADDSEKFGVSVFGSWQKRDSSSVGATGNAYNVRTAGDFLSDASLVRPGATINNAPADPDTLIIFPNDSRYIYDENRRERLNGLATIQFRPVETLTFTADAFYAQNEQSMSHTEQTNWFNRPFDEVTFSDGLVPMTEYLFEDIGGTADNADPATQSVKDIGSEQIYRSNKETLASFGGNIEWQASEQLTLTLDGSTARAWSGPNSRNGTTATRISIGAPVVSSHSLDVSSGFPVQNFTVNDCSRQNAPGSEFTGTNCNNMLDVGDYGTQVGRTNRQIQENTIDAVSLDLKYDIDEGFFARIGGSFTESNLRVETLNTQQQLGDWGINNPGDVAEFAPGVFEMFCVSCEFNDFTPGNAEAVPYIPDGNAIDAYELLSGAYAARGNAVSVTTDNVDRLKESVKAIYGEVGWKGDIANSMPAGFNFGIRFEDTVVNATALQVVPQSIVWLSDNDFTTVLSNESLNVTTRGHYDNLLPSADLWVEFVPDVVARVSFSKTMARSNFNNLFARTTANTPPGSTAFGSEATGTTGNADLNPLVSENFDISLEWYPTESSYFSIGFFDKRVRDFTGIGVVPQSLFDLRDPTSGAPGTRSGDAAALLTELGLTQSDVTLFTATALVDQFGVDDARTLLEANQVGSDLTQGFVDSTLAAYDVVANADDPFFEFAAQVPVNQNGKINGIEVAAQHFFGESGFGVQANYTMVNGDVTAALDSDPTVDQFALLGLSDSANATLIYEKYGLSARLAFNWRDGFLSAVNQNGTNRNPLFVDEYKQLDLAVSYDISENIQVMFEGINLTGENLRTSSRNQQAYVSIQELGPRFLLGARYRF